MNHVQQREVLEGAGHRDVVVEALEGPGEDLERARTLEALVGALEFVEEVTVGVIRGICSTALHSPLLY
jgi:hypothetical protein